MINFLLRFCFIELLHFVIEDFLSHPIKSWIFEKSLKSAQPLFSIRIINFVEGFVRFDFCCLDGKAMLSVFYWGEA